MNKTKLEPFEERVLDVFGPAIASYLLKAKKDEPFMTLAMLMDFVRNERDLAKLESLGEIKEKLLFILDNFQNENN